MNTHSAAKYVLVGYGWRAPFFVLPSEHFGDSFQLTGVVTRTPERGEEATARWSVPTWRTLEEAVEAERPDFIVASVSWDASPLFIRKAVELGIPVLCETPPAPDLATLHQLWQDVGGSNLVQIAEQYPLYPAHRARRAVIDSGVIGEVNEVEVSSTHMYHAMAIIRHMLGVGLEGARVTAVANTHSLADPLGVPGWTDNADPKPAKTVRAILEFSSGKVGTYDFTDNQWWNPLRADRVAIRGSLGEIADLRVTSLTAPRSIVTSHLERRQTGHELNLEGNDLDHISHGGTIVYENTWKPGRLSDDEIAVTELMSRIAAWVRGEGPEPYPLADGAHDWALALAVEEAAESGIPVEVKTQPWNEGTDK